METLIKICIGIGIVIIALIAACYYNNRNKCDTILRNNPKNPHIWWDDEGNKFEI